MEGILINRKYGIDTGLAGQERMLYPSNGNNWQLDRGKERDDGTEEGEECTAFNEFEVNNDYLTLFDA
ncbi:hypothetical protein H8S90_08615 [Olivibacter sp. SDN3]|uniref:hypothetical protein n=1 Tax=Olivibacter sp. SDN3 TaxID=2764720 RepID=UPI0016512AF2|nr:hypothetical protein [Olivibacter sp. SDN3]QNL51618.1 hypothetical protein H8S90_08615 [Olivibacter sp. SDN3]